MKTRVASGYAFVNRRSWILQGLGFEFCQARSRILHEVWDSRCGDVEEELSFLSGRDSAFAEVSSHLRSIAPHSLDCVVEGTGNAKLLGASLNYFPKGRPLVP